MVSKASNSVSKINRLVGESDNSNHRVIINSSGDVEIYKNNALIATVTETDVDFAANTMTLDGAEVATYPLPPAALPSTSNIRALYGFRIDVSNPLGVPTVTVNKGQCVGDAGELIELSGVISKRIDVGWVVGSGNGGFCGATATGAGGVVPPLFFQNQLRAQGAAAGLGYPSGTPWYPAGKNSANIVYDYETEAFTPVSVWIVKTNSTVDIGVGLTADGSDVVTKFTNEGETVVDKRRIGWRLVYRATGSLTNPTSGYPTGVNVGSAALKLCRQIDDRVVFYKPINMHLRPNDGWASYIAATGQVTRCPIPPNLIPSYFQSVGSFVAGLNGSHGISRLRALFADFDEDFSAEGGLSWSLMSSWHYNDIGCSGSYNNYQAVDTQPQNDFVTYPVVAANAEGQYGKYRIKVDSDLGNSSSSSQIYPNQTIMAYFTGWTDARGKDYYA